MSDPKIELAKQGNSQAIALLIAEKLTSATIISHEIEERCLKLAIAINETAQQSEIVASIRATIASLELDCLDRVELTGQQAGQTIPQWHQEFTLDKAISLTREIQIWQDTKSAQNKTNEFLETLQTFNFASVFPYKQVFDPDLYKSNLVRILLCFGLFPWIISAFAASDSNLRDIAWILGIYYAFIWGIVLHNLIKPDQFSLKLAIQCVLFTAFVGIPLLLFIQQVPPFSLLYTATESSNIIGQLLGFILGVGVLEEICKGIPVYLFLLEQDKLDEPLSPAFYGAMSGLGFAIAEGAHYSLIYASNVFGGNLGLTSHVLLTTVRFISLPLIHAIWAGIVGYFIGLAAINPSRKNPIIFIGVAIAAILHGVYDVFANSIIGLGILAFSILLFVTYLRRSQEMVDEMQQAEAKFQDLG